MQRRWWFLLAVGLVSSVPASAQQQAGIAKPHLVLEEVIKGMPRDEQQSVRIMTATFKPGDQTVRHTHRYPVAVYVLEGTFTLELKGRAPIAVKAGQALVEPPDTEMVGYNRSTTEPARVVIFYVATPGTPFLDLLHH
jgi:quercetin dioxygenase-like cupin family protein